MDTEIFDNNIKLTIDGKLLEIDFSGKYFFDIPDNTIEFIDKEFNFTIAAKELKRTPDVEIIFITGQKILLPGRYI
jgi:hypothetical protein